MISKFKKIVDNKRAATIQGRLVSIDEARVVCEVFNNLTEPFNNTFIKLPIDKIIEFSLTSSPTQAQAPAELSSKKRFSITEYIDKVQTEKLLSVPHKVETISPPVFELQSPPAIKPIIKSITQPVQTATQTRLNEIIDEVASKPPITIQDEFYQKLFEQLNVLKSNSFLIDASVSSVDARIEKLTESNLSMMKTFEKLAKYLEKNNSTTVLQELHENMVNNQKFISEHHKTLFENQTALVDNQLSLIETQKMITGTIKSLEEKISMITSAPASNPIINVNDAIRNTVKVVERNEAGFITKIIETTIIDDNDAK